MVSRKKILSRSRDDLHLDDGYTLEDEEDVWYQKDKIYKDHIAEVLEKWESIDDEIWAKVIVLERNRRVAKAYARAPVLTVNGSNDGFDGFRIGVNGFDNPMRDPKTEEFKNQIGQGCKIKMDETGNILIKRFGKSPIFVKNTNEENAICNDILKLPHGLLEFEKPFKLFDMKKFQQNVNREMKRNFPDRRRLEVQTISTIALVKNEEELLDSPIWIMLINIVALEMLRAKIPSTSSPTMPLQNNSCEATKRFTASGSSDEDPYSLTPSGSSGSSGKGGNYPTTDKEYYGPQNWSKSRRNQSVDLSDEMEEPKENRPHRKNEKLNNGQRLKSRFPESSGEDPYYCGMKARVPNFGAKKKEGKKLLLNEITKMKALSSNARSTPNLQNIAGVQPYWWNSRLYSDSGLGASSSSVSTSNGGYYSNHVNYRALPGDIPSYHYPGGGPRGIRNSLSTFRASPHMIGLHTSKSTTAMYHQGWE